jgi:uncharacterized protein (TIGR02646 family)
MRNIKKSQKSPFIKGVDDFDDLHKTELREVLVREQFFLCCYCLNRIELDPEKTTIEHNKPQSIYPELCLDYKNLLASCNNRPKSGNKIKENELHCDSSKGDLEISKNPAIHNVEGIIFYSISCEIKSTDSEFDNQINKVLNLNSHKLISGRKAALDGLRKGLADRYPNSRPDKKQLLKEITRLETPDSNGKLKPYCQIGIFYLKKRLKTQ